MNEPKSRWAEGLRNMFAKPSEEHASQNRRERVLDHYREKGVAEGDLPPEWLVGLTEELWRSGGVEGQEVWDLVNTSKPYPEAVPILLDWLEHFDERVSGPVTRWNIGTRRGLNRALVVDEAKGTRAVDLMLAQFQHDPPLDEETLFTAGNALKHLAGPEHFDQIAEIFARHPAGAQLSLAEWLGKSRRPEALRALASRVGDLGVAWKVLSILRRKKLPEDLKAEIRPAIERNLDHKDAATRKQAKLALDDLYPAA